MQANFKAAIAALALAFMLLTGANAQTYTPRILGSLPIENNHPNFNNANIYDRNYWLSRPIIGWNWGGNGANLDNAFHARVLHSKFLYATQW